MSGAGITVELDGAEEAPAALAAIAARVEHPRPMFEQIGLSLVTSTQRRFELGVGPDGNPWPPSLRVLAHGGKTLVLSARLMQSITFNADDSGLEEGTNVIYAALQQLGGDVDIPERQQTLHFKIDKRSGEVGTRFVKKRKSDFAQDVTIPAHRVHIPARPFLGLDDHDEAEILRIAEDFVGGQENEAKP